MSIDLVISGIQALPKFERITIVDMQRELKVIFPTAWRVVDRLADMGFVAHASVPSVGRVVNPWGIAPSRIPKVCRLHRANFMIQSISALGRKFFLHSGKPSSFDLDEGGRVWFEDSYSHKRIYTHYKGRWRGFTEGGTLRDLVIAMRDYIQTGHPLDGRQLGPWPNWYSDGDPWGYGTDMEKIRDHARFLGMLSLRLRVGDVVSYSRHDGVVRCGEVISIVEDDKDHKEPCAAVKCQDGGFYMPFSKLRLVSPSETKS